jgi:hypothetical protein
MSRYARKVDDNQADIVEVLREEGVKVEPRLARVSGGVPDLLCGLYGRLFLVEAKNPDGKGVGLSPDEINWHREWADFPVYVVASPQQARLLAQQIRRRLRQF